MSLLIVIPAHNEAENLRLVVEDLRRHAPPCEILVVDDASTDTTPELLPRLGVRKLRLVRQLGIGGALRAGLRYARNMGFEQVVRCDGDGQHQAREIRRLLRPLEDGVDAVLGSRYLAGSPEARGQNDYRTPGPWRAGQHLLAALLSLAIGHRVTDPTSGFWAFGPRAIDLLAQHHPAGYPEPELLLFLHRNAYSWVEVPTAMRQRHAGRTSLTPMRQLQAAARVALALLIVPLRAPVSTRETGLRR